MFRSYLALAMLMALAAGARAEAVKRYITLDGTRLLSKPSAFSSNLGSLFKGQTVWCEPAPNGYFKVRVEKAPGQSLKNTLGFLHSRALQQSKPKIGAMARKSQDASAEEVAAATKGFNKQVEAQYKKDNAKLDYDLVTRLEARTKVEDPEGSLKGFRQKGQLGEFNPANKGGDDE